MKRFIFLTICLFTVAIAACSPKKDAPKAQEESAPVAQVEITQNAAKNPMPPSQGAFVYSSGKFSELALGDSSMLEPTNAERGFGFARPIGIVFGKNVQDFSVLLKDFNLSQIQITAFKGITVDTDNWFDNVEDSNVAWLPERDVSMELNVVSGDEPWAEIHLKTPLKPGAYVLHDDSFLRARVAEDVSAFFPFIVSEANQESIWMHEADQCLKALSEKYGELLAFEKPADLELKTLKKCVSAHRLAWKSLSNDAKQSENLRERTIYLSRLFDGTSDDTHRALLGVMQQSGNEIASKLWRIEQYDQIQRLALLYNKLENGAKDVADVTRQIVESHLYSPRNAQNAEQPNLSLMELSWIPFESLSSDDAGLMNFFNAMIDKQNADLELVELIGAIQYQKLFSIVQKNKKLGTWFKQIENKVPMKFKTRAAGLTFRKENSRVIVGPFQFEGILPSEYSAWQATFKKMERSLVSCISEQDINRHATLILEQPLNGATFGLENRGVLRDPIDSMRKGPAVSPETIDCILNVFAKIPAEPALYTTQKAKIAITL